MLRSGCPQKQNIRRQHLLGLDPVLKKKSPSVPKVVMCFKFSEPLWQLTTPIPCMIALLITLSYPVSPLLFFAIFQLGGAHASLFATLMTHLLILDHNAGPPVGEQVGTNKSSQHCFHRLCRILVKQRTVNHWNCHNCLCQHADCQYPKDSSLLPLSSLPQKVGQSQCTPPQL